MREFVMREFAEGVDGVITQSGSIPNPPKP